MDVNVSPQSGHFGCLLIQSITLIYPHLPKPTIHTSPLCFLLQSLFHLCSSNESAQTPPPRLWTLYWSLSTSRMLASSHNPLGHTAHCRLAVSDPQPSSVHLETGTLGSTHSIHVIEIGVLFHKELANLIAYLMEQCTFSDTRLQRMTNILS